MSEAADARRVREILMTVKPLAAEYYRLTGKPLGVTGEVAEYVAAEMLGLESVRRFPIRVGFPNQANSASPLS